MEMPSMTAPLAPRTVWLWELNRQTSLEKTAGDEGNVFSFMVGREGGLSFHSEIHYGMDERYSNKTKRPSIKMH